MLDKEPHSRPGALVDRNGVEVLQCCSCEDVVFPSVYFSTASDGTIKPEYYAVLYQIAERMKTCPDKKLIISGSGDKKSSKYNSSTNTRRIDAIVKHLNEKYGISRDRIITDYKGEKNTSTDKSNANRRIDFRF
jgi:outer membrane protein OmpA-like peptidoglycan-associated protein